MLFHRNDANRNGLKIPLPAFGSRFNRAQLNTLRRAGGHAEVTAGAQIRHDGVHGAGGANNGVNRAGLNTFGTADAVCLVDHGEGANRLLHLRIAINGLRIDVKQGRNFQHHRFATGGAAVNFFTLNAYRFRVGTAARVAALPALALRQELINFLNNRIVLYRETAGGVTQDKAKHQPQDADRGDGNPDSIHYNFTRPLKPIKARDIKPAVTSAIALPRKGAGISAAARRSRIDAKRTITNEKPTAAEKPYSADCIKLWPRLMFSSATPRTAQLVVISGRKIPSRR
ncbi:hypothetical protein L1887_44837 [Cichorium endivia]|nr:hypothetical protein L1887_44837 [Cichorium endivia]